MFWDEQKRKDEVVSIDRSVEIRKREAACGTGVVVGTFHKRAPSEGSKEAMAVTEIIVAAAITGHACVLSVIGPLFCGYECDPFNPSNGYELLRQKND